MKSAKYVLAAVCALLLMFSLTNAPAGGDGEDPTPFGAEDMTMGNFQYGSPMEEIRREYGDPASTEENSDSLIKNSYVIWHYDGMELTFSSKNKLVGVKVSKKGIVGPKHVEVGKTVQDVVKDTYISPNSDSSRHFYWNEAFGAFDPQQPDCGYSQSNPDGTYAFNFVAYADPEMGNVRIAASSATIKEGCAYFTITLRDNEVISYEWFAIETQ